jgi:TrmH family RNA methyltransferase
MAQTAGFHSSHVRAARLLHTKKHRVAARCFLVEGPALVKAALDAGVIPQAVFYVDGRGPDVEAAVALAERTKVPTYAVDARALDSLAQTRTPQGIVAQIPFIDRDLSSLESLVPQQGRSTLLVLDDLDDPGNAGTLMRGAEAFGVDAVCIGPRSVDPYNDKMLRATMGSIFRVPLVRYESWENLTATLGRLNFRTVAAQAGAPDIRSVALPERCALVLGNETSGLRSFPEKSIALFVGIPQSEGVDSLNVAVAGSILLYEIARRG